MADVKTPFGNIPRWAVWGAVIGGGGAVIYMYVKKKNAPRTTDQSGDVNPSGDGSTAYGYGTNVSPYGYGAYTYQPYGQGLYGYGYGYYGAGSPGSPVPPQATTNAEWTQAVVSALTNNNVGYTGQQVLAALGPYLAGKQVTQDQVGIIQAAIAVEGYPPVAGTDGFPPAIRQGTAKPPGQGGNVIVPDVRGIDQAQAEQIIRSEDLIPEGRKVIPGKTLIITSTNPPGGTSVKKQSKVKLSSKVQGGTRTPKPAWQVGGRNEQ